MRPKARASINEQSKLQLFCCLSCTLGANLSFPRVIPNSNYGRESNSKEKEVGLSGLAWKESRLGGLSVELLR